VIESDDIYHDFAKIYRSLSKADLLHTQNTLNGEVFKQLAAATKTNTSSLSRLLNFLASVGVSSEDPAGKYHQSPLSDAPEQSSAKPRGGACRTRAGAPDAFTRATARLRPSWQRVV
jgi:hypothetical protein